MLRSYYLLMSFASACPAFLLAYRMTNADGVESKVLRAYEQEGFEMVQRACDQPGYLEALTGLDKLHRDGEAILESVEWNEEEEAEGGLE